MPLLHTYVRGEPDKQKRMRCEPVETRHRVSAANLVSFIGANHAPVVPPVAVIVPGAVGAHLLQKEAAVRV